MFVIRLLIGMLLGITWLVGTWSHNWQDNLRPNVFGRLSSEEYMSFTAIGTHFTTLLLAQDDNARFLLVGGQNVVYRLAMPELCLQRALPWSPDKLDQEICLVKNKALRECQNYVKVLQQYSGYPTRYLVCGTNAFKPMCRVYVDQGDGYIVNEDFSGRGFVPFDPGHNSTAVLVGGELYAGTVADFSGWDPLIHRKPLRTRQYDSMQLDSPDFVGSFEHQNFVYFFFRENSVELNQIDKTVVSRMARVCKNDQGGPNRHRHSWTSFLKTRLNCSVPGNHPFYFNEIQDIALMPMSGRCGCGGQKKDRLVYATFTTPVNSIGGSALCAFSLRDISKAFNGRFKEQRDISAKWLPVEEHKVPSPRPGRCINDSKSLPDESMNFVRTHPLMNDAVLPYFVAPIVIRTGPNARMGAIAVDSQVKATNGRAYDVIFIGD